MAARRFRPADWTPTSQTRIQTRRTKEPRDEQCRLPKNTQRTRPSPTMLTHGLENDRFFCPAEGCMHSYTSKDALCGHLKREHPQLSLEGIPSEMQPNDKPLPQAKDSPTPSPSSVEGDLFCDSPLEPEIVDLAAPNTWPRRSYSQRGPFSKRLPSPSLASQYSARQSDKSFGILDFYLREPSFDLPPPTPRLETPIIDPGLEKFDFDLPPKTPSPRFAQGRDFQQTTPQASSGAERNAQSPIIPSSLQQPRSQPSSKNSYRLFPIVKDTSPLTSSSATDSPYPRHCTPSRPVAFAPPHNHPDPSYRPRRESISSSIRSRKDSFNSFSGTKRIPLRVLSQGSAKKSNRSTESEPASAGSPAERSRWSDDTITSPVVATTPGPRTSFGSLLALDNSGYPDCFFEDDDEAAPLRRKFPWKRSASLHQEQRARREALTGERRSFSARVKYVVLCGGCCGGRD